MLRKKLSCAILLATLGQSAHSFEFFLNKTFQSNSEPSAVEDSAVQSFLFKTYLADADNDGNIDVFVNTNKLWLNNGKGQFFKKTDILGRDENETQKLILTDIDNDGYVDKIINSSVLLNQGNGDFIVSYVYGLSFFNNGIRTVPSYFVDLNNDQKSDIITTLNDNKFAVFVNDETVPFIPANDSGTQRILDGLSNEEVQAYIPNKYAMVEQSVAVEVPLGIQQGMNDLKFVDVDNDGDLDFWVPLTQNLHFSLFINDGRGNFTESNQADYFASFNLDVSEDNKGSSISLAIETGDIDNDGDADVWISRMAQDVAGAPAIILINDGTGQFSELPQNFDTTLNSTGITLVDIDNDGDLDALEVNLVAGSTINAPISDSNMLKIWLNDGAGNFTDSHMDIQGFYGAKVEVADLNNDGLQDLVAGNQIWMNGVEKTNVTLFDWLEFKFPRLFPKAIQVLNFIFGDWEYRYYPSVKTYVGVNTKEEAVYMLNDKSGLRKLGSKKEALEMMRLDLSK